MCESQCTRQRYEQKTEPPSDSERIFDEERKKVLFDSAFQGFRIHTCIPYISNVHCIRGGGIIINNIEPPHNMTTAIFVSFVGQETF